ncbi:phosphate starvation-inducible protein PsiE [Sphaerisporangium siamense]|uniref:Glucose/mannose-6-phosphate isomerase n=1 Tax=Sphaerisporangium siamense TaxID=795645 RepID=A0A7W7GG99_9ACTN|nr:SIS domain-containing protein [Sphaerisporangium siamense]MBB4705866.1 glucose/mannose-6-phosphate isomerase [Sphaerisporangium siamense]GII82740.1 phosphate starvation-inducible protein PsiE [Sphaerisporangium siamense]
MSSFEAERLDDTAFLTEGDPSGMLPAVATSGAQVRTSHRGALEAGVARLSADGRPRALVVAGMGGSAVAGDMLAAVCGPGVPIPIVTVRSYRLPGWVGAADLVVAVSSSGTTEETRTLALEAARRGCRLVTVGPSRAPLAAIAEQASGLHLPVVPVAGAVSGSRTNLWGVTMPLLGVAAALGLADIGQDAVEAAAKRLEDIAHRCRPSSESFINPGKTLALELAGTIPMIWGTSPLAAAAARRLASQLGVNAKYPAIWGEIPEAGHDQVAAFEGPLAERDVFADSSATTLRLFLLRDLDEHPQVAKRRVLSAGLARDRGVAVSEVTAEGAHPLERLASLVGLADYGSVYLALGYGIDPASVRAIVELKSRISQ